MAQRNVLFGISTDSEGSSRPDTPPLIPGDDGYDWGASSVERAGFPGFSRVLQYGGEDLLVSNTSVKLLVDPLSMKFLSNICLKCFSENLRFSDAFSRVQLGCDAIQIDPDHCKELF